MFSQNFFPSLLFCEKIPGSNIFLPVHYIWVSSLKTNIHYLNSPFRVSKLVLSRAWWFVPIILEFMIFSQESCHEFGTSLDYIVKLNFTSTHQSSEYSHSFNKVPQICICLVVQAKIPPTSTN